MSRFTRPKKSTPASTATTTTPAALIVPAVPAELAELYATATPDTAAFMERAARELAVERRRRQHPTNGGSCRR
jgi:hypothetical protein